MSPSDYPGSPAPVLNHPTPGMQIWGWMSPTELEWLRATAATMESVCEVGSLRGRSAFALLTGCPGPVYCIDPWDDEAAWTDFIDNCGHFPNLVPVKGLSPAAADEIPNVDMVFIDGAHDYASVIADIEAWLPKTKRLICGHDYQHDGWPDVAMAVNDALGGRFSVVPDTMIWAVEL